MEPDSDQPLGLVYWLRHDDYIDDDDNDVSLDVKSILIMLIVSV